MNLVSDESIQASVCGIYGVYYFIQSKTDEKIWKAKLRGKLRLEKKHKEKKGKYYQTENILAVGDEVEAFLIHEQERQEIEAYIYSLKERRNAICRASGDKMQILGANLDLVGLVSSVDEPTFKHGFIDRVLVETSLANVPVILILNKCDLLKKGLRQEEYTKIYDFMKQYQDIGIQTFQEELKYKISSKLKKAMRTKRTILIGQSGVGKSTLINQYFGETKQRVDEVGVHKKGKHTTTNPKMYKTSKQGELIDVPGIKEFGLQHRDTKDIALGFKEFSSFSCRYEDCFHLREPDCQVRASFEQKGDIFPEWRYRSYVNTINSLGKKYRLRRGNYTKD